MPCRRTAADDRERARGLSKPWSLSNILLVRTGHFEIRMSFYDVLGVRPEARGDEVRTAYKALAARWVRSSHL